MTRRCSSAVLFMLLGFTLFASGAPSARAAEAPSHPFLHEIANPGLQIGTIEKEGGPAPIFEPFEDPCGLAIDSSGDLYVSNYYRDQVYVLEPSGGYLARLPENEPTDGPCGLAVGAGGHLFVNSYHHNVIELAPSAGSIDNEHSTGLALDPATGDLYVDDGTYIALYEAPVHPGETPTKLQFGGALHEGYGIAVSDFGSAKGDLYVPDAASDTVKVFSPSEPSGSIAELDGAGTPQGGFDSLADAAATVDQSNGHLYVVDNLQSQGYEHPEAALDEFNPEGDYRGQIARWLTHPAPEVDIPHHLVDSQPTGLAIDPLGDLFITNGNTEGTTIGESPEASIDVFGPTGPARPLSVSREGSGGGTVGSEPAGINCGTACDGEFNEGAEVTLTAAPDGHSIFTGWSGSGCAGTAACRVKMSLAHAISARFERLPQKTLSAAAQGSGTGTVFSAPEGIECGSTCEAEFNEGSTVTLTARPAPLGSVFRGWTVDGSATACPGAGPCEVTMSEAATVEATFEVVPVHTLTVAEPSAGRVLSQPPGIQCPPTCAAQYNQGVEVTLTATPHPHQDFTGWSGAGCSATGPCTVTLAADTSLRALFAPIAHTLTISTVGSGSGRVLSEPTGIDCGATCSASFPEDSQVTLTAIPAPGSAFAGWSGSCSGARPCAVVIPADTQVGASFTELSVSSATAPGAPAVPFVLGRALSGRRGTTLSLAMSVPGAGSLSVTGADIKRATATIAAAGAAKLRLELTAAGRQALREAHGHRLAVKITVRFTPRGSAPLVDTKTVVFRGKNKTGAHAKARTGHRGTSYQIRLRTYTHPACAAPSGSSIVDFPLAHASMTFAGGRSLAATLTRDCKVTR